MEWQITVGFYYMKVLICGLLLLLFFFAYNVSGFNGIYVVFQANFDLFMSTLY